MKEIPGFYFDAKKNRYFLIKGPIPGSTSSAARAAKKPSPKPARAIKKSCVTGTSKLLCSRELNGNVIPLNKSKSNFMEEFQKVQASSPTAWEYKKTSKICEAALEQIQIDVQTSEGRTRKDVLLVASASGSLSLLEVGKRRLRFDNAIKLIPERVFPVKENNLKDDKAPGHIWRPPGAFAQLASCISCIKLSGRQEGEDNNPAFKWALITTLGSERFGSVFRLNIAEVMDLNQSIPVSRQCFHGCASLDSTIWTADCNSNGSHAAVGTNLGAALIDLETGAASWVLRSKSDVLAAQFDQSGSILLCGLRNGSIVTVDVRTRPVHSRLIRHQIPYQTPSKPGQTSRKWFELKGDIKPSEIIHMPSSVSSLATLKLSDQYFIASSMDGSIRLYDHRLMKREAVQSYHGHVNSHTRIQLGIDPSERFLMSGGEDCRVRLWSIKSGQLLFENKISKSIPSVVCWPGPNRYSGDTFNQDGSLCGAWLGSHEGLLRMTW